ncbi:lamin tail domain-containing protein [Candidatus Halobonum tyrrellensis]|uniref:ABC transporter n=1 Tax=Candidatus Halobonum tyrrellensis G22 TaxID=1324957 RepID=V4HJB8_9EURY|nr:lamin tail domain-containing protein [Candidatus Halobonum tyrrellensis]ESP88014.1 ABC transporter [Candidatus Halobonum tyrrellensis G22]
MPDPTTAAVTDVVDGDTLDVEFPDGETGTVRVLGIDTPETTDNVEAERRREWEGIESIDYLGRWGSRASEFARERLAGATVELVEDPNEPSRDQFDRLLRYVRYDPDGSDDSGPPGDGDDADGSGGSDGPSEARDTVYNRLAVAEGFARVYGSGFARHDEYRAVEETARDESRGLWARSDLPATPEIRDRPVERAFVPDPATVRTASGTLADGRAPVFAGEGATQTLAGDGVEYDGRLPLVGVDDDARVAVVGGPMVDEWYEQAEGFPTDTSGFGNFPLFTNLLASLSDRGGQLLVDGGHGQFDADYALSSEDMAYYLRYLEGQDIGHRQVNTLADGMPDGRALVVTAPAAAYTDAELAAVESFRDAGGAVLLVGHAADGMPADARENLDAVAAALGSDLRLNGDAVTDEGSALNGDPAIPVTSAFDDSFDLFGAFTPERPAGPPLSVVRVESGADAGEPTSERVVVENAGDGPLDVSGWRIADAAGHEYRFPEGLTLPAGARAAVNTGSGGTAVELYWGRNSPVWNDAGDTVSVYDDGGSLVTEYAYDGE